MRATPRFMQAMGGAKVVIEQPLKALILIFLPIRVHLQQTA